MMQSAFSNYSAEASYDAYLNSSIARSDYSSGEYAQQFMQPCPCHECYASQSRHGQVVRSYRHDPYQTAQAPVQYSPESRPALRKPNSPLPAGNMTPPPVPMPLGFPPMLPGMMVPPMLPPFPFAMPPMPPVPGAPNAYLQTPLSSNASDSQSQHEEQAVQGSPDMKARGSMVVSMAMLEDTVGRMAAIAKTPNGSSFLQAALRDRDPKAHELVLQELEPHFGALLLDTHGCYVVKGLLEQMPHDRVVACVNGFARDEDMLFHLCTDSLHTRRMVQFLLEFLSGNEVHFLSKLMKTRTAAVAKTQQGCIAMQRTMDRCTAIEREAIFECIRPHVVDFAVDPYANYVVQYMMEVGHKETISRMAVEAFSGRVANLACDKFASNVIEKCLFHVDSEAQHALLEEMYSVPEAQLAAMLDDNYGNYIVQSSIALATFRDVWMISEKLQPVLAKVPYGYKIESRLTRRLKGKTATGGPRGRA